MASTSFSAKSPPTKPRNADRRTREYLMPAEVEALVSAARGIGRYGHRDATLILMMYRHALRVSEVSQLRWELIDLKMALLHVRRLKSGVPSVHPLHGPERRALRRLKTQYPGMAYVFISQRGSPLTARAIRHIVLRAGEAAQLPLLVHPHMLRHACGFYLANRGVDTRAIQHYLGHRNLQHTVRYTELTPQRFSEFWED
jgi:type 1 fimbriae regulatory protein FimB/type 1 fimbriae regulatory protein FimE